MADSSSTTKIFLFSSRALTNGLRVGFAVSDPFIRFCDRAVIQRAVPFCGAGCVELIGQGCSGHRVLYGAGGIECGGQVLAQKIECEPTLERSGKPRLGQPLFENVVRTRR